MDYRDPNYNKTFFPLWHSPIKLSMMHNRVLEFHLGPGGNLTNSQKQLICLLKEFKKN